MQKQPIKLCSLISKQLTIIVFSIRFLFIFLLKTEKFNPFLKAYVKRFAYKALDSYEWKDFVYEFFAEKVCLVFFH